MARTVHRIEAVLLRFQTHDRFRLAVVFLDVLAGVIHNPFAPICPLARVVLESNRTVLLSTDLQIRPSVIARHVPGVANQTGLYMAQGHTGPIE